MARRMTLRQRVVALVAVAIIPASAALPYFIASIHETREREARELALRTSQIASLEMERIVTGAQGILETLAVAPTVRHFETPDCDDYLAEVSRRLPQLRGLAVADPTGRVLCAAGLTFPSDDVAAEGWFADAVASNAFVVGTFAGARRPDEAPYLPVALPVDADGRIVSVVVGGIDLAWLGARLRERNLAQGSAVAVADRDGTILAREPDSQRYVGTRISGAVMPYVRAAEPGTIEITAQDGSRRIVGYQPPASTKTGLYVAASFAKKDVFYPIYASTWWSVGLALAGAVAACTIAWLVGNRLFRQPIHRILATIESWRAGDVSARTGIAPGGSELSELAASIDDYMDDVASAREARAEAELRRTLVLQEMNHRIKNILAAVQAVANQTFKRDASPASLRAFGDRLQAMAATQDLLVRENWESVELGSALAAALAPFGPARFDIEGAEFRITARAALALSMALHELCTNAAKYGALSVPEGRVKIRWQLVEGDAGRRFHLSWAESGGPAVRPPERSGFGSQLIKTALAAELAGTADLEFEESGVRFAVDADPARVLADPAAPPSVADDQRNRQPARAQASGFAPTT
ncbi:MAG: sensor histidine kinase [Amaricoccus sp.]